MLEHALAPQHALRVLAHRSGRRGFRAAAAGDRGQGIDVAAGKEDDPGARKALGHAAGQIGVDRPGARLLAGRAELHPDHIDHVGSGGQDVQRALLHQVGANGFYACRLEPVPDLGDRKAGHADDPLVQAALNDRAAGHRGQRRPHLASHAQDQEVALQARERFDDLWRRAREGLFQRIDAIKPVPEML